MDLASRLTIKKQHHIAHVYQAGIGMPDRDYYFRTDSATVRIQKAYKKYVGALFQLTGTDMAAATKNADIVYGVEKTACGIALKQMLSSGM